MDYMSPKQAAEKWGVSQRWVHTYCETGRIDGAVKLSAVWLIPKDAVKPTDPRLLRKSEKKEGTI